MRGLYAMPPEDVAHLAAIDYLLKGEAPSPPPNNFDFTPYLPVLLQDRDNAALFDDISKEVKALTGKNDKILQLLYLLKVRRYPGYGSVYFKVNIVHQRTRSEGYVGLNEEGLTFTIDESYGVHSIVRYNEMDKYNVIDDMLLLQTSGYNKGLGCAVTRQYIIESPQISILVDQLQDQLQFNKLQKKLVDEQIELEKKLVSTTSSSPTRSNNKADEQSESGNSVAASSVSQPLPMDTDRPTRENPGLSLVVDSKCNDTPLDLASLRDPEFIMSEGSSDGIHTDDESVMSEPSTPIVRRARTSSGTRVDLDPLNLEGEVSDIE
jgi:hypothetical protein